MRLLLDSTGLGDTERALEGMVHRGENLRPALSDIADDFLDLQGEQFRSEGGRSMVWKPLRPSTIRQRGSAHPILDDSDALRNSLTRQGAAGQIRQLTGPTSLIVGTDVQYAGFHQTGTRHMVERPPVDLLPSDRERWAGIISRWLLP